MNNFILCKYIYRYNYAKDNMQTLKIICKILRLFKNWQVIHCHVLNVQMTLIYIYNYLKVWKFI